MRTRYHITTYLLITTLYVLSGKAALMLALPPGYASAIFPPAGIAIASVFIWGRKTLPWVLLGSLILNVWVSYSASQQINATGLSAALLIAMASMLQAAIGGWALRRAINFPAPFDTLHDIFRFLLLSPAICLTSATLSVGGLWSLGIFDTASLAQNWASWWIGDSLGLMVLLPIAMVFFGKPRALWRGRLATVAIPMALFFSFFVAVFFKANQWEQDESLEQFRQVSQQSLGQIQAKLDEQSAIVAELRGLFLLDASRDISREEFHRFVAGILHAFPMIQAIEWAPYVDVAQKADFESRQRKDTPGFTITEHDATGKLRKAAERNQYYPVTYIEPLAGNSQALGYDLGSDPMRAKALNQSLLTGLPTATEPVRLVQTNNQTGMLIIKSISSTDHKSGFVLSVLKIDDFLGKILAKYSQTLRFRLIDSDAQQLMHDNFEPDSKTYFERTFEFGSRHYRLQTAPSAAYLKQHRGWKSWGVLAMGAMGTSLLGALLLLGTGYTARVVAQVEERTKELRESEARYAKMASDQQAMLDSDLVGILKFKDRRIVWKNQAVDFIFGYEVNDLNNASPRIGYPDEDTYRQIQAQAYTALATQGKFRTQVEMVRKNGERIWVDMSAASLSTEEGATLWMLMDITQLKRQEQIIQHLAHHDALTGLPNRLLLSDLMNRSTAQTERTDHLTAVCYLDLDGFKEINDTYGHRAGDTVLIETSQRMHSAIRAHDTIARLGGDEFVMLLNDLKSMDDLHVVLERAIQAINLPVELDNGIQVHVSASVGVTVFPFDDSDPDTLLRHADQAMYQAKQFGKNRVVMHESIAHSPTALASS